MLGWKNTGDIKFVVSIMENSSSTILTPYIYNSVAEINIFKQLYLEECSSNSNSFGKDFMKEDEIMKTVICSSSNGDFWNDRSVYLPCPQR